MLGVGTFIMRWAPPYMGNTRSTIHNWVIVISVEIFPFKALFQNCLFKGFFN